eukprot:TRINITY_DN18784_c0_g1_i3.p1 TRINITY_DN18784_c0_g1~~TRINITY_DN18784_c0_g1_i3.p1  ORF type:complete len:241 (+),score=16.82 TRINITY_DN18784_c0_g1_i3:354-1076(+)
MSRVCTPLVRVVTLVFSFWATSEESEILLADFSRDESVEPQTLDRGSFSDDAGENCRSGNVYDAVPVLCRALAALSICSEDRILELGAGVGLPGLWAAGQGAQVVLSDRQPSVLELLRRNVGLNASLAQPPRVSVRELSWGEEVAWLVSAFDIVIACDVLYEEGAAELLFKTVSMALRDGGLFVMACKERSNVNLPEELRYAEERGLGLRLVSGSPPEQYSSIIETYCFVKASKAHRPAS